MDARFGLEWYCCIRRPQVSFESELRQIFPCFMGDTDLILDNYHQLPHSFDLKILKQF